MKRKLILPCFAVLSVLLAAYAPMSTIASAQAASDSKLSGLKQKATDELNRRIENYKKTLKSLDVDVNVSKDSASASATSDNGTASGSVEHKCTPQSSTSPSPSASPGSGSAALSLSNGVLKGDVSLPCGLKDKVKGFVEQIIKELTSLLGKVQGTQDLGQMQSLGQNIDKQFGLDQLTQVQAAVTQAISSFTGVLSKLKSTFNGLQTQVGQLKDCSKSIFGVGSKSSSTTSPSPSATASVSVSSDGAKASCGDFNTSSADVATQAQSQMDSISTVITSLSSILLSAVSLLTSLVSSFSGMTGGLGSLGSMGNLGGLSSMLNPSQLSSLGSLGGGASGLGSITGLLSSFSAITSQLDIGNFMSGNALGSLGSLGSLVNVGGLGSGLGF